MKIRDAFVDLWLFVLLFATATTTFLAFYFRTSPSVGIFQSLAASGTVAWMTRLAFLWRRYAKHRDFRDFFGQCALENRMYLIYPEFKLSEEATTILQVAQFDGQKVFVKRFTLFDKTHRVDAQRVAAINDVESLLYIAVMFGELLQKTPPVRSDSIAVENSTDSFISFGFSSNECTHMYLECCDSPMFKVVQETTPARYGEYIEVFMTGGATRALRSSDKNEIGLIIRYRPQLDAASESEVVWFICAGIGPAGTTGAAYYLANHWKLLHKTVGDKDFVCILSVKPWAYKQVHRRLIVAGGDIVYDAE